MSDQVVIANFENIHEASEAIAILGAEGIWCEVKDEYIQVVVKSFDFVGSGVKLVVQESDCTAALQLLVDAGIVRQKDIGPDPLRSRLNKFLNKLGLR